MSKIYIKILHSKNFKMIGTTRRGVYLPYNILKLMYSLSVAQYGKVCDTQRVKNFKFRIKSFYLQNLHYYTTSRNSLDFFLFFIKFRSLKIKKVFLGNFGFTLSETKLRL